MPVKTIFVCLTGCLYKTNVGLLYITCNVK